MKNIDGLILIDKSKGISSFGVIRELRKRLGIKKIGHAGTLDPLATGLMIVGVGKGTKELTACVGLDKVYEATILLGEKRSTGDMEGEILEEKKVNSINGVEVKKVLENMLGKHILPVPIYSAMKRGGEELYKKARRGEKVKPTVREMEVFESKLNSIEVIDNRVKIYVTFHVGSGTYIRSLAEEVGNSLGLPATLFDLRRTNVGDFNIKDVDYCI